MALLPARLRLARLPRVRAGRGVVIGRGVRFDVAEGAEVVLGDDSSVGEQTRIIVRGGHVQIGRGATIGESVTIVAHAGVTIGAAAMLEQGAAIVDFNHVFDDVERPIRLQPLQSAAVTVGAGARIGIGASVLAGVSVGERATVGPHAVVTTDVPAGAAVAGVPARPVATRREPPLITRDPGSLD